MSTDSDKEFFAMLNTTNAGITPMVADEDELAVFSTEKDAKKAAQNTVLGKMFGYEVFERGTGSSR